MKQNFVEIPPIVDPAQAVDYSSNLTPTNYSCHSCGAWGVKLWREYSMFLNHQSLFCIVCSGKEQRMDINSIDPGGRRGGEFGKTDQVGWRIPAVPTEANDTYWGYTSVPEDGVQWWKRLPAFPLNVRKIQIDDFRNYEAGTPEYVYYHGVARKKKGKNLSAFLLLEGSKVSEPRAAFQLAKLLLTDTEHTLFGKPFLRAQIDWAERYAEHLKGPRASVPFGPTSGIDKCKCRECFYRDAPDPYNPTRECQTVGRAPQKFFSFTGPAKKVFMPPVVYGKDLGHFCPQWLSWDAD